MRPRPTPRFETMRVQTSRHSQCTGMRSKSSPKGSTPSTMAFVAIREPDLCVMSRCESGLAKQWPNLLMKRIFATAYAECLKG